MTPYRLHRISWIAACAIVGVFSTATAAHGQTDFDAQQTAALSAAAQASPDFVKGLAKELGSTPEQAAGAAGVLFTIAKALLKPEDFAQVEKAVPGMDALLAAVPADAVGTSGATSALPGSSFTPTAGFASSSPSAITMPASSSAPPVGTPITAQNWIGSAIAGFMKMGIKPDMIAKAVPYLSGYLKKHGTAGLGSLIGGLLKTPK
jgi:Protein of unknown function VcgC/VcgE (DUF2780)